MRTRPDHLRTRDPRVHRRCSGSPTRSPPPGVAQVRVPEQGRRQHDRARRQGRRLAPDRAGLQGQAALLPVAALASPDYNPTGTFFNNLGPNSEGPRDAVREEPRGLPEARAPLQPRSHGGATCRSDAVTTSASGVDPHISKANARDPGPPRRRGARAAAGTACCDLVDDNTDGRVARLPRRARRERARAEPRARPRRPRDDRQRRESLRRARCCAGAALASLRKLDPRVQVRNPVMFVVEIGAVITTGRMADPGLRRPAAGRRQRARLVHVHGGDLAVADRRLRQPGRGAGRGPRQGPGRGACARCAPRRSRACATAAEKPASELHRGDVVVVEAGELIPGDGTVIEGIASVDESADHRRVRAGDPRVRRRPQRGHRRHAGALRPHRRRDHAGARRELPRPHDRAGRGRRAAQDAERDRARASCSRG